MKKLIFCLMFLTLNVHSEPSAIGILKRDGAFMVCQASDAEGKKASVSMTLFRKHIPFTRKVSNTLSVEFKSFGQVRNFEARRKNAGNRQVMYVAGMWTLTTLEGEAETSQEFTKLPGQVTFPHGDVYKVFNLSCFQQ